MTQTFLSITLAAFFVMTDAFLLWAAVFLARAERLRGGYQRKAGEG